MKFFQTHIANSSNQLLVWSLLWALCVAPKLIAQNENPFSFDKNIKIINTTTPKRYATIDSLFKSHSGDSLKMKTLIDASKSINYLEGESYALNALGVIYRNISFYDRAIETHENAKRQQIWLKTSNYKS